MRVFKSRPFIRFAIKSGISDKALCKAVMDAEQGLINADLGGGVIKQRVARKGQGKSGGFRTMILFKAGTRAFFIHGFAKNERGNINDDELTAFKKLAEKMLNCKDTELTEAVNKNTLSELTCNGQTIP